jgi:hypothetical protein
MMNFFNLLPNDIQRMVCFLFLCYEDIEKINPKFYKDPNDTYWKQKVILMTSERTPEGVSQQDFYDFFHYKFSLNTRDINEIFWNQRVTRATSEKTPEGTSHRDFYDFLYYKSFLHAQDWNDELLPKMIENNFFLTKDINLQNKDGMTALMYAVLTSKKEIIKTLFNNNVNLDIQDNYGWTALMYAISSGHKIIAKMLIDAKADVNKKTNTGHTALMSAGSKSYTELLQILLNAGANVNQRDNDGYTALMYTVIKADCPKDIEVLLLNGADVNYKTGGGSSAFDMTRNSEIKDILNKYQFKQNKNIFIKDYGPLCLD